MEFFGVSIDVGRIPQWLFAVAAIIVSVIWYGR